MGRSEPGNIRIKTIPVRPRTRYRPRNQGGHNQCAKRFSCHGHLLDSFPIQLTQTEIARNIPSGLMKSEPSIDYQQFIEIKRNIDDRSVGGGRSWEASAAPAGGGAPRDWGW